MRELSPTEKLVMRALIAPFTAKQIQRSLSEELRRDVPTSTIGGALSNLKRWGLVSSERKPRPDRKASRLIYRRAVQEGAQ